MTIDTEGTTSRDPEILDLEDRTGGGKAATPSPGSATPDLATLLRTGERWGYVDDDGGIHVRAGRFNDDRVVARVPAAKRAEVLAGLLLRFQDLEKRFDSLCRELRRSKDAGRRLKSLMSFLHWVEGAEAIGDYDSLLGRIHAEIDKVEGRVAAGRAAKLDLVERAEALADSNKWRSTGEAMEELMQEWKTAGSAGRKEDDALWKRFRAARQSFFSRRNEHFAELKRGRAQARETKEALIARAEALASSTDFEGTFADMQALLEEWKQAGSAGRDLDDPLWERFHAAREPFFERRRSYLAETRRRQGRSSESGGRPPREGRDGPRRDRGGAPRSPGGRRGAEPGVLRASLADRLGPLRDLFPAERPGDGGTADEAAGKHEDDEN